MAVDVYVVMRRNSELGDEILRRFWLAATKIFKNFGVEIYVVPLITNERGRDVSVIINGFEVNISELITINDAVDLILTHLTVRNDSNQTYALGIYIDRDDSLQDACMV